MTPPFPPPNYIRVDSAVPDIVVYKPALEEEEVHREVVDFSCPQCGATTAYSVKDGGLTCSHCGYYEPPKKSQVGKKAEQFEFEVEVMERAAHGWGEQRDEMVCQRCGAVTSIPLGSLTHTCVFCGSNHVIQRESPQEVLRPRYLIPFKIERETCKEIASSWLGSYWMVPKDLKNEATIGAFSPVYLPFWTFDAVTAAVWKAQVGHRVTERYYDAGSKQWKSRTKIVWRWEQGSVKLNIDDLLIEGTDKLSVRLLNRIKKFQLSELVPYEPTLLAGMQAQAYDVHLGDAWERGRQEMRERTRLACRSQASTEMIRNFHMSLDFQDETWRYILLPVFINTYQYRDQAFQMLINGQTGDIDGQRPADWRKVWIVVAAILFPGLLLGIIGLITILLGGVGIFIGGLGFILLVIGLVVSFKLIRKAQEMDDA